MTRDTDIEEGCAYREDPVPYGRVPNRLGVVAVRLRSVPR